MNKTKVRFLILLLTLTLCLFAAGCASGDGGTVTEPEDTSTPETGTQENQTETFDYSSGLTADGFYKDIKASDYVVLPEYKGVSAPASLFVADADSLKEQIDSVLEPYLEYEHILDRVIADGDTVNIDFVGTIDGVEFSGGNTEGAGTDITIGESNLIGDFVEKLIGHLPGDQFDIEETFPDNYGDEKLNGKLAVFAITINYIQGASLVTEITDTISADYGFTTAEEMIADMEAWVVSMQESEFYQTLISEATASKDLPQSVLDYIIGSDIDYYQGYADMYSVTLDEFMATYMGYDSRDAYVEANMDSYKQTAIMSLATQAIAEAEGLSVTAEDITKSGLDSYEATYGIEYIKQYVLQSNVVPAFVAANATVEPAEG